MKSAQQMPAYGNAVTKFIGSWGGTIFGIATGFVLLLILLA